MSMESNAKSVVYIIRLSNSKSRERYLQYLKDRYKDRYTEVSIINEIDFLESGKAIVLVDLDETAADKIDLIDKRHISMIKLIKSPISKVLWRSETTGIYQLYQRLQLF